MAERLYSFAGLEFIVKAPEEWIYKQERWLGAFRVKSVKAPHIFEFQMTNELPVPCGELVAENPAFLVYQQGTATVRYIGTVALGWEKAYIRAEHEGKTHKVLLKESAFPKGFGENSVLTAMCAEHLIARNQGFVFHCSYIEQGGKAVLFTAPSETGKSTQAELWKKLRGAEIINGDRAAVRLVDGELMAEGIPFSGSSQYCKNRSLPIEAIVYLEQAPQTSIRKMRGYEAFSKIWEGISVNTWDKEDMSCVIDTVTQLVQSIPVYYLPCTPDETAVETLEQELRKLDNQ